MIRDNLVGLVFGRYTILSKDDKKKQSYWLCRCSCGALKSVLSGHLKSGRIKSCGCWRSQSSRSRVIDLTGKEFGWLIVIRRVENCKTTRQLPSWLCKCKCGNEIITTGENLRSGSTKSCGCFRRSGDYIVKHGLCRRGKRDEKYYQYRCNNDITIRIHSSVGSSIRNALKRYGGSKHGSSILGYLPFTMDELKFHLENLWEPWMSWDNYGGKINDKRKTWHIDHIKPHSLFSYKSMSDKEFSECWSLSNLQPLEKLANIRKGNKYEVC